VTAYYNEHDPFAAAWLRELIRMGRIAPGVVDERSIEDIVPADLDGYTQCHFFAGIGVWSYALRRAGWPDNRPVWTGSCPCQPFSAAGKAGGFADERHLWSHWYHLIQHGKPEAVPIFGEQVASKDGLAWLDLVQTDLERAGYACGAVDLCAAGVGAPNIRQRLFFVAHPHDTRSQGRSGMPERTHQCAAGAGSVAGGMADADQQQRDRSGNTGEAGRGEFADCRAIGGMADTDGEPAGRDSGSTHGPQTGNGEEDGIYNRPENDGGDGRPGPTNGLWRDADWLYCRDGKWRPVEPGTFPLAHGAPARVGRLRGYGNAINAEVATAFIEAYLSIRHTVVPVNFL